MVYGGMALKTGKQPLQRAYNVERETIKWLMLMH